MIDLYQVDSFTNKIFGGNPAAVCPLDAWLPDETLQNIAFENNLSETAFFLKTKEQFHIRWFTPTHEIDLCGHATLTTAFVIFNHTDYEKNTIKFTSQSGELNVERNQNGYTMNFPIWEHTKSAPSDIITKSLGKKPVEYYAGNDHVAVFATQSDVLNLKPDFKLMATAKNARGILITAPADNRKGLDFVSRCFFPALGIDEDPVTGSAHCILVPIWAEKLGKKTLKAKQISNRSGDLLCEIKNNRIHITGNAVLYMKGQINVDHVA